MFLYAIPGRNINKIDFDAHELKHLEGEYFARCTRKAVFVAPDGTEGNFVLLGDRRLETRVTLDPTKQKWTKCGESWIGYYPDTLPTPETLSRGTQLKGRKLELAGHEWEIPIAISFDEIDGNIIPRVQLSRYFQLNGEGKIVFGDVEEQFSPLYDAAMNYLDAEEIQYDELCRMAGTSLSYNYFMDYREACILQLLTVDTATEICSIVVDTQSIIDLQKKTAGDGSSTSGGGQADTGTTSPQSET